MDIVIQSLEAEWIRLLELSPRLAMATVVLLLFALVGHLAGRLVSRILHRSTVRERQRHLARRGAALLVTLFGVLVGLHILGLTGVAASLLATGGMAAIVLGFAFREIGENFLAGLFLAFDRSFSVGDLVESGGLRGVVKAVELRHVHIRTGDGCDIFIPSSQIFKNPLQNFTRDGLRRTTFTVGADYRDDPVEVRALLLEAVGGVRGVLEAPAPRVAISDLAGSWVEYTAHLWVDVGTRRSLAAPDDMAAIRTSAMSACHRALRERGVTFTSDVATTVELRPVDVSLARSPA